MTDSAVPKTCLCDLGISHPDIEPCNTPEISPVGGEFEICLGCGHDAKCHGETK